VAGDLASRIDGLSPERRALLDQLRARRAQAAAGLAPIPRRPDRRRAPLSFAQERLWFLDQLMPGTTLFVLTSTWHIREWVDHEVLDAAVNEMVRRHEILRTTFVVERGEPVQLIAPERRLLLSVTDLRSLDPATARAEAGRLARREAHRPFDLERGPLLRASLLTLDDDDHIFVVAMHHIVSDGWSMGVVWNELCAVWDAFAAGEPSPLPDLPVQYGDVAAWERDRLSGDVLGELLGYWRGQLADLGDLELPADRPRPDVPTGRGRAHYLAVPRPLAEDLRRRGGPPRRPARRSTSHAARCCAAGCSASARTTTSSC